MKTQLVRISIIRDWNERNERAYLVTPYYRMECGRVVSVPDTRGFATRAEAIAEAERIGGGKLEPMA